MIWNRKKNYRYVGGGDSNLGNRFTVRTDGGLSKLYIRDYRPEDYDIYQCIATRRNDYSDRTETVYNEVRFTPRQSYNDNYY